MPPRSRQAQGDLERIINQPLKGRQRTNHQNPDRQPIPQTLESHIPIYPRDSLPRALTRLPIRVQLGNHDVGRVRDDGAADTSDIAAEEGNTSLLEGIVARFGTSEVGVDFVDRGFEGGEFYHCVGDLTGPEGVETFVESGMIVFLLATNSFGQSYRKE